MGLSRRPQRQRPEQDFLIFAIGTCPIQTIGSLLDLHIVDVSAAGPRYTELRPAMQPPVPDVNARPLLPCGDVDLQGMLDRQPPGIVIHARNAIESKSPLPLDLVNSWSGGRFREGPAIAPLEHRPGWFKTARSLLLLALLVWGPMLMVPGPVRARWLDVLGPALAAGALALWAMFCLYLALSPGWILSGRPRKINFDFLVVLCVLLPIFNLFAVLYVLHSLSQQGL